MFDIPHHVLLVGGLTSFGICLAVVLTEGLHGHLTHDNQPGVQKFHAHPTPRIGGLGIYFGLIAAALAAPAELSALLWPMAFASIPAFLAGLLEDLTKRVGVRERLLATIASGLLISLGTGITLTHLDLPGIDLLLAYAPLSMLFTAFAIGGVANAVNIIDGFNGLAAGTILVVLSGLGLTAYVAGDPVLAKVCFVLGGVTAGFLVINFPLGKIFLGDGGAYLLGFLLAWVAVLLPMRNPGVSPWASLLACAYPILEVLFSVLRRRYRNHDPGQPDRLHLHSLVKTRITRKTFPNWPLVMQNAAVSPGLWLFALMPAGASVLLRESTVALMAAFLFTALLYALLYRRLIRFALT